MQKTIRLTTTEKFKQAGKFSTFYFSPWRTVTLMRIPRQRFFFVATLIFWFFFFMWLPSAGVTESVNIVARVPELRSQSVAPFRQAEKLVKVDRSWHSSSHARVTVTACLSVFPCMHSPVITHLWRDWHTPLSIFRAGFLLTSVTPRPQQHGTYSVT